MVICLKFIFFFKRKSNFIFFLTLFFSLEICPAIKQYCNGRYLANLKETGWRINLNFEDFKSVYDPIIKRIIQLIDSRLRLCDDNCIAIIFAGKIGESDYFQSRMKEEFGTKVKHICAPDRRGVAITVGGKKHKNLFFFIKNYNANIFFISCYVWLELW
jgi:hypothetical protein